MNLQVERHLEEDTSVSSLEEVLAYQNEAIIHKFQESYDLPFEEVKMLFEETKKWLWLNAVAMEEKPEDHPPIELFIDGPLALVDEMWHTFILFTRPYQEFCNRYFGFYIHHAPTTKAEKDEMKKEVAANPEKYKADLEEEYALQYSYVYDKLGEETLSRWYEEFTDRYTPEFINQVRKPYQ